MASSHDRNTLPEGDRPAEQLEGSSNDAVQEQAADTPQDMQLKKPILDVSTVVTRNTLEEVSSHRHCFNRALSSTHYGT